MLSVEGEDGERQRLAGEVLEVERLRETSTTANGPRIATLKLRLGSRLWALSRRVDWRVLLGLNVEDLVRTVCADHGFEEASLVFRLSREDPVRPYTLQAGETDLAFVQRVLARAGLFFHSRVDEEGREIVFVVDHNAQCDYLPGGTIAYRPTGALPGAVSSGTEEDSSRLFYRLRRQVRWRAHTHAVHDTYTEAVPEVHFEAESRTQASGRHAGRIVHEAPGVRGLNEAQDLARQCAEADAAQADRLRFAGTVVGLGAGTAFSLDARRFGPHASGDYLTVALTHRVDQRDGQVGGDPVRAFDAQSEPSQGRVYRCEGVAIRRTTPYRPSLPAFPDLPQTFTARIESNGPYARLDEQGRYRLRQLFDTGATGHAEASPPLRRLTPHGGPPGQGLAAGLHTPLLDGDEVLMGCLNGDPDRPYVIGALPNAERAGPVTSANKSQNCLRTATDNELLMDDSRDAEAIALRTFAGHTILQLDAARAGQRIRLAASHGAMHLFAKRTQQLDARADLTERSGDSRTQTVEDAHHTKTQQAEIHHQAAADVRLAARATLASDSGKNTELQAAKRVRVRAERDARVTVQGSGGLVIQVQNGTVHAQSANDIRITGQGGGDISFAQAGGGFKIDPGGNVQMWGNKVAVNAPVSYQGPVNYEIGSAPAPGTGAVAAAAAPQTIRALRDPGSAQIYDLAWDQPIAPLGEAAGLSFSVKNFKGGEQASVHVFVIRPGGEHEQVDTVHTALDDGTGYHALAWISKPTPGQMTIADQETQMEDRLEPLRYVFEVHVGDVVSPRSGPLLLTGNVECAPTYQDGTPLEDDTPARLVDALGTIYDSRVAHGKALFKDVVIGPWRLSLGDAASFSTD